VKRKCAFCGRKVKIAEDWVRAQLLTGCAVFHWACSLFFKKYGSFSKAPPLRQVPVI
jgi:hypothetical protein